MKHLRLAAGLLLLFGALGCARAVSIGSDPAPTYTLDVHNATNAPVNVFYLANGAERVLGQVGSADTERFVIAATYGPSVRIIARPLGGGGVYGPYDLLLGEGEVKRVVVSAR